MATYYKCLTTANTLDELNDGSTRKLSNYFLSGKDYLLFNTTVAYNQWNRVAKITASNSGWGVSFIITVCAHHNSTVHHAIFLCSASYGHKLDIKELSGPHLSNVSIRINCDNTYPGEVYVDLKSESSYTSTGATYLIKIIGLQTSGIETSYTENVSALTYSFESTSHTNGGIYTTSNIKAASFYNSSGTQVSYEGHTHTKSQITDFPSSMPASDVYSWAKASSKPTYTYSEVGAAAANHTHSYLPLTGGSLTGSLTFANGTWNVVGDDCAIGDHNVVGGLGLLGLNGNTRLDFCLYGSASNYKSITFDGTTLYLDGNCSYATTAGNADTVDSEHVYQIKSVLHGNNIVYSTDALALAGKNLHSNLTLVTAPDNNSPLQKVWYSTGSGSYWGDWFYVTPGETIYLESWIMRPSNATGTAGTFYVGIDWRDKLGKAINANSGCVYMLASDSTVACDGTWHHYTTEYTVPKSHTAYNGSDGGGFYYGQIRILVNYYSGTIPTYFGGVKITRYTQYASYATTAGSAPASDVYSWAKASTKPSYTYSEVGAAAASHTHSYLPLSGGTLTSTLKIASGYGIEDASGKGMLCYHPIDWEGISSSQWGVGAIDCQGIIRSNNSDLIHYKGGNNYTIIDSSNYTSYCSTISHTHNYLPLSGGWIDTDSKIYWKGKSSSTSTYTEMGYRSSSGSGTMHCTNTSYNNSGFYIQTNGYDASNDWGGIAIDNEGVTVFGAGDAGGNFTGVFRVLNEDNISDGPQFLVTKSSGCTSKYSMTASSFYESSDIRYKNIQSYISPKIEDIANLPMFKYTWTNKPADQSIHIGSSAQAVEEILPELITEKDNFKSLDYSVLGVVSSITIARKMIEYEQKIKDQESRILYLESLIKK